MIPNVVFVAIRYVFLALIYIFIMVIVMAIYRDVKAPSSEAAPRRTRKKKGERPGLMVVAADRNLGARYNLSEDIVIGRAPGSGIVIDDTYASQQHARVYRQGDTFFVEDLGSTNGTYVNGRKISYPLELRPGDRIKIGKTVFEFHY